MDHRAPWIIERYEPSSASGLRSYTPIRHPKLEITCRIAKLLWGAEQLATGNGTQASAQTDIAKGLELETTKLRLPMRGPSEVTHSPIPLRQDFQSA